MGNVTNDVRINRCKSEVYHFNLKIRKSIGKKPLENSTKAKCWQRIPLCSRFAKDDNSNQIGLRPGAYTKRERIARHRDREKPPGEALVFNPTRLLPIFILEDKPRRITDSNQTKD